ncbi:dTMP kinase [bacterium]|nr:dTMP kinase [bacterium]
MSKFISFEGIEGVGKTTQIELLKKYLSKKDQPFLVTKEPGGTKFGMQIRKILLDPETDFKSKYTEVLLFFADRAEHLASVVEPALKVGTWVICDRYVDSTIAYQIGGRQIPPDFIEKLSSIAPRKPDKTILLDLNPIESLERAKNRAILDRFEKESFDFHNRVRQSYLDIAAREPERVSLIDVTGKSEERVFEDIEKEIRRL